MMHRTQLAAFLTALVSIGTVAAPAEAIELFTNFNNGTELGTRPLDVDEMSPVRVHAWQGRWHGPMGRCFNDTATAVPRSEYVPNQQPVGVPALAGKGRLRAEFQRLGSTGQQTEAAHSKSAGATGQRSAAESDATGQRSNAESASAGGTRSIGNSRRKPFVVQPANASSDHRNESRSNDDVLRSSNFLPPAESN